MDDASRRTVNAEPFIIIGPRFVPNRSTSALAVGAGIIPLRLRISIHCELRQLALRESRHSFAFHSVHLIWISYTAVVTDKTSSPDPSVRRRARLRIIGAIVLALGLVSAGLVYWLGTRSAETPDDLSMLGYNKARSRQMAMLYGKMGLFSNDLIDNLKRPGVQAAIITGFSTFFAAGCFYLARLPDEDDEVAVRSDSHHG